MASSNIVAKPVDSKQLSLKSMFAPKN